MAVYQPFGHFGCHLHPVENAGYTKGGLVQDLRGMADGLLTDGRTGLYKQEAQGCQENNGGKQYHPQTHTDGEFFANVSL